MDGRTQERTISNKELIKFYQFKRTVLFFDEWGFYLLLISLYKYSYPFWLLFPILFYGGGAIYTSYVNLNKIETEIIDVDQEIYVFNDLISKLYQLNIEMVQRVFWIVSDYIHRKSHPSSTSKSESNKGSNDLIMEDIDSDENNNMKDE
jgi:hypothetical protein